MALSDWTIYLLPIYIPFWFTSTILRLVPRIWIISLIHCFRIGIAGIFEQINLSILQEKDDAVNGVEDEDQQCRRFQTALENYRRIQKLVKEFNQTFGVFTVVSLMSMIVSISVNIFMAIFHLKLTEIVHGLDFTLNAIVYAVLLYYLCWCATLLENEVTL